MKDTEQDNTAPTVERLVWVKDRKTGVKYQERRLYRYDPVRRFNVTISCQRTGLKLLPGQTEPVPCRTKAPSKKSSEATPAAPRRKGVEEIMEWAGRTSGLTVAVHSAFPAEEYGACAEQLLSVAQYFLLSNNGDPRNIGMWQCSHNLPYVEGMDSDICHDLFEGINHDEDGLQRLFMNLAALSGSNSGVIAYASAATPDILGSATPCTCPDLSRTGDWLDSNWVLTFCSAQSGLPISFAVQPGGLGELSSVLKALEQPESILPGTPELVLNSSFVSQELSREPIQQIICELSRRKISFTIPGSLEDAWIFSHLEATADKKMGVHGKLARPFTACPARYNCNRNIHAATVIEKTVPGLRQEKGEDADPACLYIHYYLDAETAWERKRSLHIALNQLIDKVEDGAELDTVEKKVARQCLTVRKARDRDLSADLREERFETAGRDYGFFVLVSNVHKDPWEALRLYRTHTVIENAYQPLQGEYDSKDACSLFSSQLRGRKLCRMLALGYRFHLQEALASVPEKAVRRARECRPKSKKQAALWDSVADWAATLSVRQMLDWFGCVEIVHVNNAFSRQRWSQESLTRDEMFLELLLDEA